MSRQSPALYQLVSCKMKKQMEEKREKGKKKTTSFHSNISGDENSL